MTRLPVKMTTRAAWAAANDSRTLLLRLALLPFIGTLAIDLLPDLANAIFVEALAEESTYRPGPLDHAVICHVLTLLKLALQSAFIAQAFRLFLLGPAVVAGDGWFRFGPEGRRLFLLVLVTTVLTDLPFRMEGTLVAAPFYFVSDSTRSNATFLISHYPDFDSAMALVVLALAYLVYIFVGWALAIRLAFALPATCLGRPLDLKARWRETHGNGWRLFAALLRLGFLVILIGFLLGNYAKQFPILVTWIEDLGHGEELSLGLVILQRAASWICSFAIHALWAAVTTVAFAFLTGYPAKGVRLAAPQGHAAVST